MSRNRRRHLFNVLAYFWEMEGGAHDDISPFTYSCIIFLAVFRREREYSRAAPELTDIDFQPPPSPPLLFPLIPDFSHADIYRLPIYPKPCHYSVVYKHFPEEKEWKTFQKNSAH